MLKWMFSFDEWHVMPLSSRPYAQAIINYLNAFSGIQNKTVVEIGCGLGDILRNIKARHKLGLDSNRNVLRALKLICLATGNSKMRLRQFTFPQSELDGQYDIVICVNWIHHVAPLVLKDNIDKIWLHHMAQKGALVIDTVDDPAYRYNHRIDYLTKGLCCEVTQLGAFERQRKVHVITKIQ